jgi:outer membrane receptor for ferrienterochelin and colicins
MAIYGHNFDVFIGKFYHGATKTVADLTAAAADTSEFAIELETGLLANTTALTTGDVFRVVQLNTDGSFKASPFIKFDDIRKGAVIEHGDASNGGGAIAGLVNLVSKTPTEKRELNFLANSTSALGLDLSGFYAEKFKKVGFALFTSYNKGTAFDPADIGLTAIPKFDRWTVNPRIFFYLGTDTKMDLGVSYITEERLGGNIDFIRGYDVRNPYFEKNFTDRFSTQFNFSHRFSKNVQLRIKNSISNFERQIEIPDHGFSGQQSSTFSEVNLITFTNRSEWVWGINLWSDQFEQREARAGSDLSFSNVTVGLFGQNTFNITQKWTSELGMRVDYQSDYDVFVLPRISLLFEPTERLTFRLGGGIGYKTPTVFSEEAERLQFRNISAISPSELQAEESIGGNFDVNYRWPITDKLLFSLNSLFFYSKIKNPLVLTKTDGILALPNTFEFSQPNSYVDTKGIEINMKWSYNDLSLFIGYTYADVNEHYNGKVKEFPLVANHRFNNVLMYEKHENFWIGFEAYYFSPQKLSDGSTGQNYWIVGLMTEKSFGERLSVFLNFENFLDARQTAFDSIYTGDIRDPQFRDIYAPVDGFVINGGVKLKF